MINIEAGFCPHPYDTVEPQRGAVLNFFGSITTTVFHVFSLDGCVPCTGTSTSTDDGSDGNFYCLTGQIGGERGSCTCSCLAGFSGVHCETALPCVATDDVADTKGGDGNFYCINGGDIGGTTNDCTCTSCDEGFAGTHCELASCQASTNPEDDGSGSTVYCVNGSPTGTSGSCSCECSSGFVGSGCATLQNCVASSSPGDDGSDGSFYCINEGVPFGFTGSCGCTCYDPFFGPNCANEKHTIADMSGLFNTVR